MTIRFDGQTIIITGAGAGLGRAYALAFAERGGFVVVNDLNKKGADETVQLIEKNGGHAQSNSTDITRANDVGEWIGTLHEQRGKIDVLVNNAGIVRDRAYHNQTHDEWRAVLDVHLEGAHNLTRSIWPIMRQASYGRIVMATSGSGLFGNFGQANYGAAKMALVGLMNTLAIEGLKYNIKVNAIAPVAYTAMTEGILPPTAKDLFKPDVVAPAVLYLSSNDAPNATIMTAGAGAFCASKIIETSGVFIESPSPEKISDQFDIITDYQSVETPGSSVEQVMKFAQKTS